MANSSKLERVVEVEKPVTAVIVTKCDKCGLAYWACLCGDVAAFFERAKGVPRK